MKKKHIMLCIVILLLLLPFMKRFYTVVITPAKVLMLGVPEVDDKVVFEVEVTDKNKIQQYEELYESLQFTSKPPDLSEHHDYVIWFKFPKDSVIKHTLYLRLDPNGGGSLIHQNASENPYSSLSKEQLQELKEIFELSNE